MSIAASRHASPQHWRWGLPLAAVATVAWQGLALAQALVRGRRMAAHARRFEMHPPHARMRVLLLGDSTGVGVGTQCGTESLPGLLAAEFPNVQIVNACINGARVADVLKQLHGKVGMGAPFDLVLVLAGGNDVLKLTPPHLMLAQADDLLMQLMPYARQVVWLGSADLGTAPALKAPLSWALGWLCRRSMRLLGCVVRARGAEFIDFCGSRHSRTFTRDPLHYFAADGLHPSAAGYRHCFEELKRQTPLVALLT